MDNKLSKKLHDVFYVCQTWIDDCKYIPVPFRQKSYSDEFYEKIIRKLRGEMVTQKCCFQADRVYVPTRYLVEISEDDSNEWQGEKRKILLRSLNDFLENELRNLSVEISDKDFVQIRVSKLKKGEVKITHFWRESYLPEIRFFRNNHTENLTDFEKMTADSNLREKEFYNFDDETITVVEARSKKLFTLEVRRGENHQMVIPVFQTSLTLGRSVNEDILLPDDLEISRHHLVITYQQNNKFIIFMVGQNPVFIRQTPLFTGQSAYCFFEETVRLGSYKIKIKQ